MIRDSLAFYNQGKMLPNINDPILASGTFLRSMRHYRIFSIFFVTDSSVITSVVPLFTYKNLTLRLT